MDLDTESLDSFFQHSTNNSGQGFCSDIQKLLLEIVAM